MPNGSISKSFQMNGHAFSNVEHANQTFTGGLAREIALPAGKLVTAWVKTDANTAACNLPAGHGYTSGKFDVYFAAGMRYGVDGVVTGDALALDGGTGTDFPATAAADVVCTKQVSFSAPIDGDVVSIFGVHLVATLSTVIGNVDFQDVSGVTVKRFALTERASVTGCDIEYAGAAAVAQLTGNPITQGKASNGSSTTAATLYVDVGEAA